MLLTIVCLLLDALIWQALLSMQRIAHPYPKTLIASLAAHYLGLVTPARVGQFLAAGYISSETGITFGYALSSVVMRKLVGWVVMMGFGLWALPLLAQKPILRDVQGIILGSLIVLVILSAGIGLWVVSLRRLGRKWQRLSPWQIDVTEFWSGMRNLCSFRLIEVLGIGVLAFSILLMQLFTALQALGMNLPFGLVIQIAALSQLVARLVPISVIGFGSKDAIVIGLLTQQGFDPALALSATLLLLIGSYLVTLLISGLSWWVKPLVIQEHSRS